MLKVRLLTGLILAPAILAGLFWFNTVGAAVLLSAFIAVAAFEWAALCELQHFERFAYVVVVFGFGLISLALPLNAVMSVGIAWWLYATWDIFVNKERRSTVWSYQATRLTLGVLVLVPTWRGCVALKAFDPAYPALLFLLLFLVWTADSAAYFVGRAVGHRRLAATISPGKSVEGVMGGVAGGAFLVCGWALWSGRPWPVALAVAGFAMLVVLFSVVGDLTESKAKRLAGVKDSGHWLPGHGGVLDRIDALTAAVPVFVMGIRWLVGDRS